ncbi:type I restriction endonuclease subunit R [Arcanobacterium buesumense]|uniref:Type I restriction enzyme endonuclease subunit n=1 Tax=Arcanobacterium buesumense TaxID=2722751 RepID=A0A6H2EMS8_9ACTO|nr:type I restriction endonuclease subunit R [Arcanobacterium buesumense]QJC22385.1 type I restriction endonuclease subunit R [Arcanobacterium buesumense]
MTEPSSAYRYSPVVVRDDATVVAKYEPEQKRSDQYQTEAQLEEAFIAQLQRQAYERLSITSEAELIANLRTQLELLNDITFSDTEWQQFFTQSIANKNEGIVEKTQKLQADGHIQPLIRDDGSVKNILLINKKHIHANRVQVLNQYEATGTYDNRYDVTILVNGLPLVHVELKRRGVNLREAFNQINRYQRDSFWAGSGLYEYIQIFVISNGTRTKYYSNTTRAGVINENKDKKNSKKTSNSYAFTIWWADAENNVIDDLMDFAKTFFAKHSLLNILTKYCVFNTEQTLLVMRPYQIVATERILNRVLTSTNSKTWGTTQAGGYIWHTTGSGKTLTSFKTAQLATKLEGIDKVLFVVDRKDLDFQTIREYNRFQKDAVSGNASTAALKAQLENPDTKIVVTTIQKLSIFVKNNAQHDVYGKHVVIIFDECHRSQFGDMHKAIRKSFKRYHLFGFTGTPIFAVNSPSTSKTNLRTTEQVFGDKLHTYTIVDAINDKNVLPFRIDYINTIKAKDINSTVDVAGIETETALLNIDRIRTITDYILDHFAHKTKRNTSYSRNGTRIRGFNSILTCSSIDAAKMYYNAFQLAQAERAAQNPGYDPLKIAIIYSYAPNEEDPDEQTTGLPREESLDADKLDASSREFLDDAISDYNDMFGSSFSTYGNSFENYYKDVSKNLKEQKLDMLIVVDMFLTGFDAPTLNTLWVDKNLRSHGLIQAFSRTNRILNSVKAYGNIVCFRNLEEETDAALELFGNKKAGGIVLLKSFNEYYASYQEKIAELHKNFPLDKQILGEKKQKEFVGLWGSLLRLVNILSSFDEFNDVERLDPRSEQDYQSIYLELYEDFRRKAKADKESIADDVVFEIELAKQVEVNVDYILRRVSEALERNGGALDKEIRADITRSINASPTLHNKRDLIEAFLAHINVAELGSNGRVDEEWSKFIRERFVEELNAVIETEKLKPALTTDLVTNVMKDGADIPADGTAISNIMPPISRFRKDNQRGLKRERVVSQLQAFIERFRGLGGE